MKGDGSYIDGLITYNTQSNHSFGVNLEQLKQDNYHTTASNIEGYLVNKQRLLNEFNVTHILVKQCDTPLRFELLILEIPSAESDIPKSMRINFLQRWNEHPINEKQGIPHIILGNNYSRYHPKPFSMSERQLAKFPVNKLYTSALTSCTIFTGPLKFGELKSGLAEFATDDSSPSGQKAQLNCMCNS